MATSAFSTGETSLGITELPSNTILVHATNCLGEWGSGFALALAEIFPTACDKYKDYCNHAKDGDSKWPTRERIAGTCYLIEPQREDFEASRKKRKRDDDEQPSTAKAPQVYIGCLFTSYGYGRPGGARGRGRGRGRGGSSSARKPGKDDKATILAQTRTSLKELRKQVDEMKASDKEVKLEIYSPQFNSGAFKIPWEDTEDIIREEFEGWGGRWHVMRPP